MMELVFATNNPNKLDEIRNTVPEGVEILSLEDIGCHDDIPETAETLEGNARIKAEHVKQFFGYDCFADDTGLEVDALDGAPGVYSARYAGENVSYEDNVKKLLQDMDRMEDRSAHFKTVICLFRDDKEEIFEGRVDGSIRHSPKGDKGFGYDPIFQPKGYDITFAEMDMTEKNKISHRGRAVQALVDHLKKGT